jgi:uroporphyrinogen decarboxylase
MGDMSARQRVTAALGGEAVDRVPISFWGHHYVAENSADGLAQETLRQWRHFDWDYLKPQSRAQAFAEMWGLTYTPSDSTARKYATTHVPFNNASGLSQMQPADPQTGALGEQLEALRQIRAGVGPDVPIVWTVFSPLMVSRYLLPGEIPQLLEIARSQPNALEAALEAIAVTLIDYARACLENGADGLFYATNLATDDKLTPEEVARFQRPYDLRVLDAAAAGSFNIMHVCGPHAMFDAFADYPVHAFSWAAGDTNPTLSEGHQRTGRAVLGGVPNVLHGVSEEQIAGRVRSARKEMHDRWLLLAPDCSIDINTPDQLLLAARAAARAS